MIIDLNSDLGESFGNYSIGNDVEVMKYITSANIACGFHAGDPIVIEKTIKLALENKVAIGAHPGYPDLIGFGRRSMKIRNGELSSMILYQVSALKSMTEALGGKLAHVKPHGALYRDLAHDYKKSLIVAETIHKIDPELIFVGLANSKMLRAAREVGLKSVNEVFADRSYNDDGSLVSRLQEGAVINDEALCIDQVNQMLTEKTVQSINGNTIPIQADSICVHGDTSKVVEFVKNLSEFLTNKGIELKSMKSLNLL
ncbi:MAG: LamB/YcsF family protein [Bacteroidales bacterium]|nr:LamB/YcsF family protein [Bacteroidales bacterium]